MAVVGIDLGTTNTVIAAVRDGRATALKDSLGRTLLPSVISLPAEGQPIIGYDAKERRSLDPENTIFSIKRLIGRSWESEHVQKARQRFPFELKEGPGKATLVRSRGADYTLPEISALVLEQARAIAEERLGEAVSDVVITVPANFNDLQRAATKVAARVAGLEVLRILNEPTAAALAYGFGKKGRERIAVYDFGGGTFDITLLDLSENVFEVLATAGDTFLGGDDVDVAIVDLMADELRKKHGIDAHKSLHVREQLRSAAEKLKIDLSTRSMAKVRVEQVGHGSLTKTVDFEFAMKRADFEKLAEPLVERTLEVCQEAMNIAGLGTKDLDQVLLVGGSTRIPLVRRRISSFFGKMPQSRVNPDEVVAIGAAIQATALESKGPSLQPPAARTSSLPPGRSQFPSAPGIAPGPLARGVSTTKTGLAGLRKTMPGTGGSEPPPGHPATLGGRTEGSILSALPKTASPTRPDMPAVRLRGTPDPLTTNPDAEEPRGPKTLMGVGEPDAGPPPGDRPPLVSHEQSRPPTAPLGAANPRAFKTLAGVGPDSPVGEGALPAGPTTFKTLAGAGPARSPFKTLAGVAAPRPGAAPTPSTAPLPMPGPKTEVPLPSDGKLTGSSTLSRLPPLSDSKTTTQSTLSRLGTTEGSVTAHNTLASLNRQASAPPPRKEPHTSALGEDDFDEVTSIYPERPTPSLAPSGRPSAFDDDSTDHDPFADLPASLPDADLPTAVQQGTSDGSVVFDFEDLVEDEGLEAADLPVASVAQRTEHETVSDDMSADLPIVGVKVPRDAPAPSPALRTDLPLQRDLPAPRTDLPARQPTPVAPEIEELSMSAIDLDELGSDEEELDVPIAAPRAPAPPPALGRTQLVTSRLEPSDEEDEFELPLSSGLDGAAPLGTTQAVGSPLQAARAPAAQVQPPTSLRSTLGADAFGSAPLEKTALGGAAAPAHASGAEPLSASTWSNASGLARTAAVGSPALSPPGLSLEGTVVARDRAPLLIDVTPLSLGVEVVGGYVDQLIERNSPIPCERTRTFATSRDHQTFVRVRVSQGESSRFEANTVLGEVELTGLAPGPRGSVRVDVTFSLDESGMLQVAAKDQSTGMRAHAVLKLIGISAATS